MNQKPFLPSGTIKPSSSATETQSQSQSSSTGGSGSGSTNGIEGDLAAFEDPTEEFEDGVLSCSDFLQVKVSFL